MLVFMALIICFQTVYMISWVIWGVFVCRDVTCSYEGALTFFLLPSTTWALHCFTLLVAMNFFVTTNCSLTKDIYVILFHILGRERFFFFYGFVNVFTRVSKHIEIFWDQI
jgi:hypothetical protein